MNIFGQSFILFILKWNAECFLWITANMLRSGSGWYSRNSPKNFGFQEVSHQSKKIWILIQNWLNIKLLALYYLDFRLKRLKFFRSPEFKSSERVKYLNYRLDWSKESVGGGRRTKYKGKCLLYTLLFELLFSWWVISH